MTTTPPLEPIVPAYHLNILSDAQLDQMQEATLHILEEIGVHCPSQRALALYAEHGARVDADTQIVRLPREGVLEAMSHAPRHYTMGARDPAFDLRLDGTSMFCATDGCGIETVDFETRQRRPSVKDDVAKMARISDSLPSIGFYWPIVSAQDYPLTAPLHELDASFSNTVKHVQSETVMDEPTARYAVEMATVIAGDEAARRARPPLSLLVCCIAPLALDDGGMEAALVFAEAGLPVGFMSMANVGSTAPATLAGTIAQGDAEIVAAMTLIQMMYPGAATYHSLMAGLMHPRTGGYLSTPWSGELPYAIGVELAHRWGVPTLAGCFGTDAPAPGWQSAGEAASALLLVALVGAETGSGMGLLDGCTVLYPEEILLDDDIYQRVRCDAAGLDIRPETLALDLIAEVGPRGHYLAKRHTRDNLRRLRFSSLTAQPADPVGFRDPLEVAREQFDAILASHRPEPLPDDQQRELTRILQAADRELAAEGAGR